MQQQALHDLYQQFMDQNAQAFAGRHFELAYHALAAAMHCAHDLRNADLLSEVQRFADEQGRWIDASAPEHTLSSGKAQARGNKSIFESLAGEAKALQLGLKVEEQADKLRQLNEKSGGGSCE